MRAFYCNATGLTAVPDVALQVAAITSPLIPLVFSADPVMKKYDVFISHAYADRSTFSNELAFALKNAGLKIWYSGFELQSHAPIGAGLRAALREVHYGILIISPAYLQLPWAIKQLNALLRSPRYSKRLLPVYLGIDKLKAAAHFAGQPGDLFVNETDEPALIQQLLQLILKNKHIETTQTGCITLRDMPAAAFHKTNTTQSP